MSGVGEKTEKFNSKPDTAPPRWGEWSMVGLVRALSKFPAMKTRRKTMLLVL